MGKRQTPPHHLKPEQAPDLDFPGGNTGTTASGTKGSSMSHVNKVWEEFFLNQVNSKNAHIRTAASLISNVSIFISMQKKSEATINLVFPFIDDCKDDKITHNLVNKKATIFKNVTQPWHHLFC